MRTWFIVFLFIFAFQTWAQELPVPNNPAPYPGGSPFPPGGEPELLGKIQLFWIANADWRTEIKVQAKGHYPSQVYLKRNQNEGIRHTIHPETQHHFWISPEKEKHRAQWIQIQGQGSLEIEVYGWPNQDPMPKVEVVVQYFFKGQSVGKTQFKTTLAPISP